MNNGGSLHEPRIIELTDPSYKILVAQWTYIQGKNAEGWLGIEGKPSGLFGNDYDWFYSKSGDEVPSATMSMVDDATYGSCVYLKGEKGKGIADSCEEVRGFICEFEGTL